jgi:SagB-type dehydrogenase family enzyme
VSGRCRRTSSIRFTPGPEIICERPKKRERGSGAVLSARVQPFVALRVPARGDIAAEVQGHSIELGTLSERAADRARKLQDEGLRLSSFESARRSTDKEIQALVHRLARHGLLEYRLTDLRSGDDLVVIEPQVPDYWPKMSAIAKTGALVLSRFAYMRRRGEALVLESPRAGALFKVCKSEIAAALAVLSTPRQIEELLGTDAFPGGVRLLSLLVESRILFETKAGSDQNLRLAEGDDDLVLWDFHDLLFHTRSTEGRHANPLGGIYPYANTISPLPTVRPPWPGEKIALEGLSDSQSDAVSQITALLRQRRSTRSFDDEHPITAAELSRFLDGTARILPGDISRKLGDEDLAASRPYPSAGASYELELYLAVNRCEGMARGFYHFEAGEHALVPLTVHSSELDALLMRAAFAMAAPAAPQILIIIAARFGRVSWKYKSIAYALVQKDAGVLIQSFYVMATAMGLGGCAVGIVNIDLFAKMTGIALHIEGPVGQFALGRAT